MVKLKFNAVLLFVLHHPEEAAKVNRLKESKGETGDISFRGNTIVDVFGEVEQVSRGEDRVGPVVAGIPGQGDLVGLGIEVNRSDFKRSEGARFTEVLDLRQGVVGVSGPSDIVANERVGI